MFHNNLLKSQTDQASTQEVLSNAMQGVELSTSSIIHIMQTPPRVKPSSSILPPQMSLSRQITDGFTGETGQSYQNFFNFLTSGQSQTYNDIMLRWSDQQCSSEEKHYPLKHNFNLNKHEPFYSGGLKEDNIADDCAANFLNFFWNSVENLNLVRARHAVNKEEHTESLTIIKISLENLSAMFQKDQPFKINLNEFLQQIKNLEPGELQDQQVYIEANKVAWAEIKMVVTRIPEKFNEHREVATQVDSLFSLTRAFFASYSDFNKRQISLKLKEIHKGIVDFTGFLVKKSKGLDNTIRLIQENLNASCLSFVTAKSQLGTLHCYLSISSPQHNSVLLTALHDCVAAYNNAQSALEFQYEFHVISEPASDNSQLLLQKIIGHTESPHPDSPFKHCAEKSFINMLAKLSYEKDVAITGISNVNFLPLNLAEAGQVKRRYPQSKIMSLQINREIVSFCIIPACKNCHTNKIGALIYISAAAEYREYVLQQLRQEQALQPLSASYLNTPQQWQHSKSLFTSPLKGLWPLHKTPSPDNALAKRQKSKQILSEALSFPSLVGLGSPKKT